eukprot:COSAG01_NODE_64278_length_277_cov_0.584270_1_plen_24_part_10
MEHGMADVLRRLFVRISSSGTNEH